MSSGAIRWLVVIGSVALIGCAGAARDKGRDAERRNRLQLIGSRFHNYHDVHDALPPAPDGKDWFRDGKPHLSWRVHLLPFVEQRQLYDKFHMNEPWDSEHNLKLLSEMPQLYRTTSDPTKTTLFTFYGNGALYGDDQQGCPMREITDGSRNTIMVVEAGADKAVPWTKPDDLFFDPAAPKAALGKLDDDLIFAVTCDGQAVKLKADIDPAVLSCLITRAGGESVDVSSLAQP